MSASRPGFHKGPFEFRFIGSSRTLLRLTLKGLLLSTATLGVKFAHFEREFWSYLFSHMTFIGTSIKYTPRNESERIYHVSCGIVVALAIANMIYMVRAPFEFAVYAAAGFLTLLFLLFPLFVWMFLQSKLECLSWNDWQFRLKPLAGKFALRFYSGFALTVLTLGLYGPLWWNNMYRVFINALRIGPFKTHFSGRNQDIMRLALRSYPYMWLTFGLYHFWLGAAVLQYEFRQTWIGHPKLGAVRGSCYLTGNDLFGCFVTYFFLVPISAGLLFPLLMKKNLQFFCEKMRMRGFLRISGEPLPTQDDVKASLTNPPIKLQDRANDALRVG